MRFPSRLGRGVAERMLGSRYRLARELAEAYGYPMAPHDREEYRQAMGHVWLGFSGEQIGRWMEEAGFEGFRRVPLPPDPAAKGPTLFAASARCPLRLA